MEFTREYIENKVFIDQAITFDRLSTQKADNFDVCVGAFPQVNGDVLIRIVLPDAENVRLHAETSRKNQKDIVLTHDAYQPAGVFEGSLPYDENMTGIINVSVFVDDVYRLIPELPLIWTNNRPFNAIEVPDPDNGFIHIRDVPHGAFTRNIFRSSVTGDYENCYVYTPAGYMKSKENYPVLYLLHGAFDNELSWEYSGRMSHILDNLIAEKKAAPMLVVLINGMLREGGEIDFHKNDDTVENMLVSDVIPFVESHYRTLTGKPNRAIGGLSMGAYMTCAIALKHSDLFNYVGTFTACVNGDSPATKGFGDASTTKLTDPANDYRNAFKTFFRSTTPQEDHPEFFAADDLLFEKAGLTDAPGYRRIMYPARTTKWNSWRMGLRDYVQLVFK